MRYAITGASGYVGHAFVREVERRGGQPVELGRRPSRPGGEYLPYTLGATDPDTIGWGGVEALIHGAYDFRLTDPQEIGRINVEGSVRLLQSAHRHGVRRGVFISSFSAFEGCRSHYGRAKLRIEAEALRLGYAVVRPGLVFGGQPGGTMGSLWKVTAISPVLPLIGDGSYPQYLVHEDDLAAFVCGLCESGEPLPGRPLSAANPERVPLREVIRRIAARQGKRVLLFPVPWPLVLGGARLLEALRLPSPFRSDSLIGLVYQNPAPDFTLPPGVAASFRPFQATPEARP